MSHQTKLGYSPVESLESGLQLTGFAVSKALTVTTEEEAGELLLWELILVLEVGELDEVVVTGMSTRLVLTNSTTWWW